VGGGSGFALVDVAGEYPAEVPQVVLVHQYDAVVVLVVGVCHLACGFAAAVDVVACEHAPCGRIDGVADFFGACRGGCDFEVGGGQGCA